MEELLNSGMPTRPLGKTGLLVPALGFGSVKIGRSGGLKHPGPFSLPDEADAARLLHSVLDLGMTLIDTAPAYGLSEERIGRHLRHRRREYVLATKAGEEFDALTSRSRHDFSPGAILASIERSVERLGGPVDVLLVHADDRDAALAADTSLVATLERAKSRGVTKAIGFSGKTVPGAGAPGNRVALAWADVLMVEYHMEERSAEGLLHECKARGVGVLAKKVLGSGRLPAEQAIRFVLQHPGVDCAVVGGVDLEHMRENARVAAEARRPVDE
jgi:aryl-alcohol dehydrogenase-like predicted oxidoreductase